MIPIDCYPPKVEIVHEVVIKLPKKEDIEIYPVRFFEHQGLRAVNVTVSDLKQHIFVYDVIIYFEYGDDFVSDLQVPLKIFSFSNRFDWHQDYLEELVKIILKTTWKELIESHNQQTEKIS